MDNNSTWVYSATTGSQSSLWHILPHLEAKHNGWCWVYLPSVTAQDQTPFKTSSHTVNTARYDLSPPFIWTVLTTVSRQAFRKISLLSFSHSLYFGMSKSCCFRKMGGRSSSIHGSAISQGTRRPSGASDQFMSLPADLSQIKQISLFPELMTPLEYQKLVWNEL